MQIQKKISLSRILLGTWDTKTIVAIAIGAALFGVLIDYAGIPIYTNTKLSVAHLVVIVVGALFGPLSAGLVGLFGNFFGDLIAGSGFWPDWWIGNFIVSYIIGLLPLYGARITEDIFTKKQSVIFGITSLLGIAVSFGFISPFLNTLFFGGEEAINFAQGYTAVIADGLVVIIVGIPLLFALAKRYTRQSHIIREERINDGQLATADYSV
ncbi:ECF-type riboflavin transporter substrate-binding protein [Secundilactobacillus oryzae]|uniref:ECF-type riboflavin transporter substrate-binding protein n=1 Tax=Secundilactobacillus oryzae TaxID=1202668 RepID=UPI000B27D23B|nr:ECF-type riboflavin transporter substrate-binding protein [Secundilactobacillus oryzae]